MDFDVRTLLLVNVTNSFVAAGAIFLAWYQSHPTLGLRGWAIGLAIGGAGSLLLGMRGIAPDVISVLVGNVLVAGGFATIWMSLRRFNTGKLEVGLVLISSAAFTAVFLPAWLMDAGTAIRIVIASGFLGGVCLLAAWEVWRGGRQEPLRARGPMMVMMVALAAIFLGRVVLTLIYGVTADFMAGNWLQGAALFGTTVILIGLNLGILTLANERLRKKSDRLASVDELTNVWNRRALMEKGERLARRAAADGSAACVLMFDLDHFHNINGTFGHEGGDLALAAFATFVQQQIRPTDLFGRYGGEEFCALLIEADLAQGGQVAERLRSGVAALTVDVGQRQVHLTVSIGIALLRAGDFQAAIRDADAALFQAKEQGRNRVVAASDAVAAVAVAASA